jgi:poly-gamma-glutamate synthesis protein (capsule biosynthesis protein)
VAGADSAAGLRAGGFTVMSCANNHISDAGSDGLATTLALIRSYGIATAGAGADAAEAHRPGVVTTDAGVTVALLAYACYYPFGVEATTDRAGIATVGGRNLESSPGVMCSPGVAPTVTSIPDEAQVEAMVADIQGAAQRADLVLTSFHWGDATRPCVLTDHERRVGRLAIDAGAHAVFGHHHHVLRGVEQYGDAPIFYGLGNFVWDAPEGWAEMFSPEVKVRMERLGAYALRPRPGYPRLPFHPDGRMTMIARCRFGADGVRWFGLVPCMLRPDGRVEPLHADSPEGQQVVDFLQRTCDDLQLPVTAETDPSERVGGYTAVRIRPAGHQRPR